MLFNSGFDVAACEREPLAYNIVETLLDDVSNQIATSNPSRRYSRCGQRASGGSSRVAKTSSASNSPRNTIGRRKTLMTDGLCRRRPMVVDQGVTSNGIYDGLPATLRPNRPVSWHPSSHMTLQASYQPTSYAVPKVELSGGFNAYEVPTPAVFSGYASPVSTFSPLSLPFTNDEQQFQYTDGSSYFPSIACNHSDSTLYAHYQSSPIPGQIDDQCYVSNDNVNQSMYSHFGWSNFDTNGFDATTAPPTPEDFIPIQHPDPTFSSDEAIPYHPLDDSDSAGEELIGMGLYDTPEKPLLSDPHLDSYRALMVTQILGPTFRKQEPTGKGLKLEETWNPPASDDGEEDDVAEDDEDLDGSTANEDDADIPSAPAMNDGVVLQKKKVRGDVGNDNNHFTRAVDGYQ